MIKSKLPRSIERFVMTMQKHGVDSPLSARNMLADSGIEEDDVLPWAEFEHPATDGYGRRMVHQGANYELMVMTWLPGDFSAIHDHGATQWGAVLCLGDAEHATFTHKGNVLTTNERETTFKGEINEVDQSLIHQMGNRNSAPFLSVHLYGCHANRHDITGDARIFDLLEQQIQFTDGGVFYGLPDDQINRRIPGPRGDIETTIEHHRQLAARIARMQQTGLTDHLFDEQLDRLRAELALIEAHAALAIY